MTRLLIWLAALAVMSMILGWQWSSWHRRMKECTRRGQHTWITDPTNTLRLYCIHCGKVPFGE